MAEGTYAFSFLSFGKLIRLTNFPYSQYAVCRSKGARFGAVFRAVPGTRFEWKKPILPPGPTRTCSGRLCKDRPAQRPCSWHKSRAACLAAKCSSLLPSQHSVMARAIRSSRASKDLNWSHRILPDPVEN